MKTKRVVTVLMFGAAVGMDGMLIERAPLDRDPMTPGVYLSHPTYARSVLRPVTDVLRLGALTSTGDSLLSFDTDDITGT